MLDWRTALQQTFSELARQVIEYAPQIIGALALLLLGWLVARLLRLAVERLVTGLDSLFVRLARHGDAVHQHYIKSFYARVLGRIVFWVVLLFFAAASASMLGWNLFSGWLDALIGYLPKLITGLFIILAGFLLSGAARATMLSAAGSAGLMHAALLGRITQIVIVFVAGVVGIEQLGINVDFLTTLLIVLVAVVVGGATLAFSLGARDLVANLIGAHYLRKYCAPGDILAVEDAEGEVVEITATTLLLETESGRVLLPAGLIHRVRLQVLQRQAEDAEVPVAGEQT